MKQSQNIKQIAEKVVLLISERKRAGLDQAIALLRQHYPDRPNQVARAYEIACQVVVKRILQQDRPSCEPDIFPEADWYAIQAAEMIQLGHLSQGFSMLRLANNTGARHDLCREIVFAMLRSVDNEERVTELHYAAGTVAAIEVGHIRDSGLVVVSNAPAKLRVSEFDLRSRPQSEEGAIYLRDLSEVAKDTRDGYFEYKKIGNAAPSLSRVDWSKYLERLSAISARSPNKAKLIAA